ncbi:MAG: hypothetical protein AAGM67_02080 [Bacteroidota bacterium]
MGRSCYIYENSMMKVHLEQLIRSKVKNPRESEIQEILDVFEARTYAKGQIFKKAHTQSTEIGFICSGSTRSFFVRDNGHEITGAVTQVGNFVADLISIRSGEQTPICISFLEDTCLLVCPFATAKDLLETNLAFNILIRDHIAERAAQIAKRMALFLTGSAKERYEFFLQTNPKLHKKLPLRLIASLIGITPTQLSRIRNQK